VGQCPTWWSPCWI